MDRQLAFVLIVMAEAQILDRVLQRCLAGGCIAQAERAQIPAEGNLYDLAIMFTRYQYDLEPAPVWLKGPEPQAITWREDETPTDSPTTQTFTRHALDVICSCGMYELVIYHATAFPEGKGFVPSVRTNIRGIEFTANGGFYKGVDEMAHLRAMNFGYRLLLDKMATTYGFKMKG